MLRAESMTGRQTSIWRPPTCLLPLAAVSVLVLCMSGDTVMMNRQLPSPSTSMMAPAHLPSVSLLDESYKSSPYGSVFNLTNDARYMHLGSNPSMAGSLHLWGERPRLLKGLSTPVSTPGSTVKAGLQVKLKLVDGDSPRWNPSIIRIDPSSKLSNVATFIAAVRGGIEGSAVVPRLVMPGDPPGGWDAYPHAPVLEMSDTYRRPHGWHDPYAFGEVVLLDSSFRVMCQSPIELPINTTYEDPRLMYLQGQVFIYTVSYKKSVETADWNLYPYASLRPLDLSASLTHDRQQLLVQAAYREIQDPLSLPLSTILSVHDPSHRAFAGKNHMVIEAEDGLHIVTHFEPLEVWRVVDRTHAAPVDATQEHLSLLQMGQRQREGQRRGPISVGSYHLNGGKFVDLPETGELLGMIHWHVSDGNYLYTQAFFTITTAPPYRVVRLSPEFCFSSITRPDDCDLVQFVSSIERVGDVIVVPYGKNDLEAMVFTMDLQDVMDMLRPVR